RKMWNTYANRRVFKSLHGVDTVYSKAGIPINLTIVRENIEDTYGGIEHMLTRDVALGRRFITREGSRQVHKFAFEMARKEGITKIHCGHKANIMKLTDGLFLDVFYEVAKDYPEIKTADIIVDDLAMKLVVKPQDFQMVVLTNLQGDIISDLCAGLVGGLGFAPSANIGDNICIFEAVHGTAPDIAGQNKANPTSLLLSGVMLLRHLGIMKQAALIENALLYTLEKGIHTGDFGDKKTASVGTKEFAKAIIQNFGQSPKKGKVKDAVNSASLFKRPVKPAQQKMMSSPKIEKEGILGMDLFIESEKQASEIAAQVKSKLHPGLKLIMISNRGTMVWPSSSLFTECVNQYRVRIEGTKGLRLNDTDVLALAALLSKSLKICSVEMLNLYGEKRGYSLAQGQ
ncbi:MAG: isocitrate dehydrogenase, partial [Bacteroidetes bacterium]|nr:isocitrate dehydrogenase [Bacteroidota bacterium]